MDYFTFPRKIEKKKTAIERLKEQLFKLEVSQTDKVLLVANHSCNIFKSYYA